MPSYSDNLGLRPLIKSLAKRENETRYEVNFIQNTKTVSKLNSLWNVNIIHNLATRYVYPSGTHASLHTSQVAHQAVTSLQLMYM